VGAEAPQEGLSESAESVGLTLQSGNITVRFDWTFEQAWEIANNVINYCKERGYDPDGEGSGKAGSGGG